METQLKKGVLEIYVLEELRKHDSYGYELVQNLSKHIEMSESTLYPILRRLEKANELETYNLLFNGRNRKYYKITKKGIIHIESFVKEWLDIYEKLQNIRKDI